MVSRFFTRFTRLGSFRRGFIRFLHDAQPFNPRAILEGPSIGSLFIIELGCNVKANGDLIIETETFDSQFSDALAEVSPSLKNREIKMLVYGNNLFVLNSLGKCLLAFILQSFTSLPFCNPLNPKTLDLFFVKIPNHPP